MNDENDLDLFMTNKTQKKDTVSVKEMLTKKKEQLEETLSLSCYDNFNYDYNYISESPLMNKNTNRVREKKLSQLTENSFIK